MTEETKVTDVNAGQQDGPKIELVEKPKRTRTKQPSDITALKKEIKLLKQQNKELVEVNEDLVLKLQDEENRAYIIHKNNAELKHAMMQDRKEFEATLSVIVDLLGTAQNLSMLSRFQSEKVIKATDK